MGYYVTGEGEFTIALNDEDNALAAMHALNKKNDLKRGGSYSGGKKTQAWFSWLSEDYPAETPTLVHMLEMLGFDVKRTLSGDGAAKYAVHYDNKTGQEDLFLGVLSGFAAGTITWRGEDGEAWRTVMANGAVQNQPGHMVFEAEPLS